MTAEVEAKLPETAIVIVKDQERTDILVLSEEILPWIKQEVIQLPEEEKYQAKEKQIIMCVTEERQVQTGKE